jgi:hypothetical protein
MLKGFMVPRSALGHASIDPPPPWHYSGDVLAVEFWADPAVTASMLPQGLVELWRGEGQLSFPQAPGEELHSLGPVKVCAGFRYGLSYSVTDLEIVKDFTK